MKHETSHGKNLKLVGIFLVIVLILVLLSFLWKVTKLISNSHFDERHQFVLEVLGNASPTIVSFSPEVHTISVLFVTGNEHVSDLRQELEIPIDAHIVGQANDSVSGMLWRSIWSFHRKDDINLVDKLELWFFITSAHADSLTKDSVSVPLSDDVFTNVMQKLFLDKTIYSEEKTIEIINASGIPGFGGRLAKLLTNIGGNVIMVTTAPSLSNHSTIVYSGPYTYTNKRIDQILNLSGQQGSGKPTIADIMITLGTDLSSTTAF